MQSAKPVELSSIINVVQHESPYGQLPQRKMELKSVVCLKSNVTKSSKEHEVKGHNPKSPSKVSKVSPEKPVLLLPFGHQVSGRASILCYDETTLLKPYVSRELFFYETIPEDLKKFTPQFRGLVTVSFIEDSRTASVLAYALPRTLVKPNTKNIIKLFDEEPKPHSKRCVKDYGKTHVIYPSASGNTKTSFNINEKEENLFVDSAETFIPMISQVQKNDDVVSELSQGFDVTVCIEDKKPASGKENEEHRFSTTGLHNPWNSKVLDDAWLKLKFSDSDNPSNGKKKRFTLLENAVARYRRPCVLDLKIGTRVRENASPEKIARHVTAINLGARLSGMQVYHPEQQKFTYHNKYYGHNLTVSGFKSNLRHFFSRGAIPIKGSKTSAKIKNSLVDKKLVEEAAKKLTELKNIIESIQSHRFYSSSILLLYEGDVSKRQEEKKSEKAVAGTTIVIADKPTKTSPASEIVIPHRKLAARSFSFSELLQRWKQTHTRHHSKHSPDHRDSKHCDSRRNYSSQKHFKSTDAHKKDVGRKNGDYRTSRENHDRYGDDFRKRRFESKSWPPRSKSSGRRHSHKIHPEKERADFKDKSPSYKDDFQNGEKVSQKHHCDVDKSQKKHSHKDKDKESSIHSRDSKHHHDRDKERPRSKHKSHHNKHSQKNNEDLTHDEKGIKSTGREDLKRRHSDVYVHGSDIEVKMIDFAHYCFHDNEMHPGPDGGFIYGLERLIELLNEMLKF